MSDTALGSKQRQGESRMILGNDETLILFLRDIPKTSTFLLLYTSIEWQSLCNSNRLLYKNVEHKTFGSMTFTNCNLHCAKNKIGKKARSKSNV